MGRYETSLHELVELAREKGYAIDFAVYDGPTLDRFVGGVRVTAPSIPNPMVSVRECLEAMREDFPGRPDPGKARLM